MGKAYKGKWASTRAFIQAFETLLRRFVGRSSFPRIKGIANWTMWVKYWMKNLTLT